MGLIRYLKRRFYLNEINKNSLEGNKRTQEICENLNRLGLLCQELGKIQYENGPLVKDLLGRSDSVLQIFNDVSLKVNDVSLKVNDVSLKVNEASLKDPVQSLANSTCLNDIFLKDDPWVINFIETSKELDIISSYKELVKGMEDEDRKTVAKILSNTFNHENGFKNYSLEELKELYYSCHGYEKRIINLNGCFFYDGYWLPVCEFEASTFLYNYGLSKVSKNKLKQRSIIDAGAYVGDSSVVFERNFPEAKIYAFEPSKPTYELMSKTLQLNASRNIIPVNLALGDKCLDKCNLSGIGMGKSLLENNNVTNSTECQENKEAIVSITLDSFVESNNLSVGMIKTDLEGYEQMFLRGAEQTIKKQRPTLIISIYHNANDFFNIKSIIENMDLGYSFKIFKALDGFALTGTLLIAEV